MNTTQKWAKYYHAHKKFWFDPEIPPLVKAVVRAVELHRSDAQGWSLSVRIIARYFGVSKNTASKAINEAIRLGYLRTSSTEQRKRRKLRLSVSLRHPVNYKKYIKETLGFSDRQAGSSLGTGSGSLNETVNSKSNNKSNTVFKGEGFKSLREIVNRLRPAHKS